MGTQQKSQWDGISRSESCAQRRWGLRAHGVLAILCPPQLHSPLRIQPPALRAPGFPGYLFPLWDCSVQGSPLTQSALLLQAMGRPVVSCWGNSLAPRTLPCCLQCCLLAPRNARWMRSWVRGVSIKEAQWSLLVEFPPGASGGSAACAEPCLQREFSPRGKHP